MTKAPLLLVISVTLFIAAGTSCQQGKSAGTAPISQAQVQLASALPDDKPAGWGTIKGTAVFAGVAIPARIPEKVDKDADHCLSKGPLLKEEWIVNPDNKGVQNVFVWLAPAPGGPAKMPVNPNIPAPSPQVLLEQPCCQFVPHALAIREGQDIVAKNDAPVPHNVNYQGGAKNPGDNKLVPSKGQYVITGLVASTTPIKVSCNIHPWMGGWIRVFDHPYFAVTDKDGKFVIKNAPAGDYQLVSWHEAIGWGPGGKTGQKITIKADGEIDVKVDIKPE